MFTFDKIVLVSEGAEEDDLLITMEDGEGNPVDIRASNTIDKPSGLGKIEILKNDSSSFEEKDYTIKIKNNSSHPVKIDEHLDKTFAKEPVVIMKKAEIRYAVMIAVFVMLITYIWWFQAAGRSVLDNGTFFIMTGILLSGIYMLLFPATSTPDAKTHFLASYRLSNMLLMFKGDAVYQMRKDDLDYMENV